MDRVFPTFSDVVTIYHRTEEKDENGRTIKKYSKKVVRDSFFSSAQALKVSNELLVGDSQYVARLPLDTVVGELDLIVLGEPTEEVEEILGKRITDIAGKYKPYSFFVKTIQKNDKIPCAKHIKVTGV